MAANSTSASAAWSPAGNASSSQPALPAKTARVPLTLHRGAGDDPRTEQSRVDSPQVDSARADSAQVDLTRGDLGLGDAAAAQSRRKRALAHFGDFTLAYNTAVQEGLEYFWCDSGYLAFCVRKGNVFVLGDPVADRADFPALLGRFTRRFPQATFVQVSSATAAVLETLGYYINEMGVDTTLLLNEYSFAGKSMERIRYASNWLHKRGYQIQELDYHQIDPREVAAVSDHWRSTRRVRRPEMRFLNRPIRFNDEVDVRKFFLRNAENQVVAFFYFDPLYRDGKVIGYATAIKRRLQEAPIYAEQGIMRAAVETFIQEGKQEVKLGLSPLAWIENKTFRCNPLLHYSFRYGFQAWWTNRYFYNLQGHAQYKRHFRGTESPLHYASPVIVNDVRIASLLRLTGVY